MDALNQKGLAEALVAASAELANPPCDRANSHFNQRYATLRSVTETVRPVLARHGLAVSQQVFTNGDEIGVRTVIVHRSGEISPSECSFPRPSNIQHAGGVITYLRRYALCAALNIVGDDDQDAEDVVGPTREPAKPAKPAKSSKPAKGSKGAEIPQTPIPDGYEPVRVVSVQPREKDGRKWFSIELADPFGNTIRATTFSETNAGRAEASVGQTVLVRLEEKQGKSGILYSISDMI